MKKSMILRLAIAIVVIVLAVCSVTVALALSTNADDRNKNVYGGSKKLELEKTPLLERLMEYSHHFIVIKAKQMGGSHYAYTEALNEAGAVDLYSETNFDAGAEMVILSLVDQGNGIVNTYEKSILKVSSGIVRDPDISADGTKVLYSKKNATYDDYHIYEMNLTDGEYKERQLTFGNGRADIEPQYLPNGDIVFSSTRDTQTVDCWYTPVSNLYVMSGDGTQIRRVGYDQVHTTFPTVTSDGRVLYTRWDYNDRTQMYIQGVFQMFHDGSYQTEVWGNNADFPTTLLHTREIPGSPGKYITITSGHHVQQKGKVAIIDTTEGRNSESAVRILFPDSTTGVKYHTDAFGQTGKSYKYPYALDENTFLVSEVDTYSGKNAAYSIYLCDRNESFDKAIVICGGTAKAPASQIVPIDENNNFNRTTTTNYSQNKGVYYVANVYEGETMKNVAAGSVKYLRVVGLEFRASAVGATTSSGGSVGGTADIFSPIAVGNGSWDVKEVLGVVPVEEDGSAMFYAPSDTPLYFQLLDAEGRMIQTMRSWSTIMPGESNSCIGCHEDKNTAPTSGSGITLAMKKGVQNLQKEPWMEDVDTYDDLDPYDKTTHVGFSYRDVVQTILDSSCIVCHSNYNLALSHISAGKAGAETATELLGETIPAGSLWAYETDGNAQGSAHAPFGDPALGTGDVNTKWTSGSLKLTRNFTFTQFAKDICATVLEVRYSGSVTVKVNGETVYTGSSDGIKEQKVTVPKETTAGWNLGVNTIAVEVTGGKHYAECTLSSKVNTGIQTLVNKGSYWKYLQSSSDSADSGWYGVDFDDSSWRSGRAPFGDRGDVTTMNTSWTGNNSYIWIRQEFTLTAEEVAALKNGEVSLNIFYDDTIDLYVNGVKIFSKTNWNDNYAIIDVPNKPETFLREGKNVIAASLHNTGGGRAIDLALRVTPKSSTQSLTSAAIALTGEEFYTDNNRLVRSFPLSYYVLTSAVPSGSNWQGNVNGKYVRWISTMSGAEAISAYTSGSTKSALIDRLRSGHGGLTEAQIRAIECWIDLAVPCAGSYDEGERFPGNSMRYYEEKENKRDFYDTWDAYSKMDLAGKLPTGTIELNYKSADGKYDISASGLGYTMLYTSAKYAAGDTVTVRVTGSKYVALSLNERQGEVLLYLPEGEYTYTLPAYGGSVYCATMYRSTGSGPYRYQTVFARIPTEEELSRDRNLALNPYDVAAQAHSFPHVSGANVENDKGVTLPYNAVDGFDVNKNSGAWPYQAYEPTADGALKIDFGREVVVNELQIKQRAAAGDTHAIGATVTFSDGSKQTFDLYDTTDYIVIDLGGKTVTSIEIGSFELAGAGGFALSEVRVIGHEA